MTCPFYGMHDRGLGEGVVGVLRPSHGNQCALMRPWFSACRMEMKGLPVEWGSCCLRAGPDPSNHSRCSTRCVGCRHQYPIDFDAAVAEVFDVLCPATADSGLCPACLRRAELLALEAAGQGRLIP